MSIESLTDEECIVLNNALQITIRVLEPDVGETPNPSDFVEHFNSCDRCSRIFEGMQKSICIRAQIADMGRHGSVN